MGTTSASTFQTHHLKCIIGDLIQHLLTLLFIFSVTKDGKCMHYFVVLYNIYFKHWGGVTLSETEVDRIILKTIKHNNIISVIICIEKQSKTIDIFYLGIKTPADQTHNTSQCLHIKRLRKKISATIFTGFFYIHKNKYKMSFHLHSVKLKSIKVLLWDEMLSNYIIYTNI